MLHVSLCTFVTSHLMVEEDTFPQRFLPFFYHHLLEFEFGEQHITAIIPIFRLLQ